MKLARSIGAVIALTAIVFGVPWVLLAWGRPDALLQVDWAGVLSRPDDGRLVLGLLSVAGWVAWLLLAATTVAEAIGVVTGGAFRVGLPGTGWLRPAIGSLVAAALAPTLASGPSSSADLPPALISVLPAAADGALPGHTPSAPQAPEATPAPAPAAGDPAVHVVQPGDEIWTLAETYLGSGERWREFAAANPGMSVDRRLVAGELLRVPRTAAGPTAAPIPRPPGESAPDAASQAWEPRAGRPEEVTVRRGDTLWDLAAAHLGDPLRWPEIFEANRDLIEDPDEIDIGWRLRLPSADPPGWVAAVTSDTGTAPSPQAEETGPAVQVGETEPTGSAGPTERTGPPVPDTIGRGSATPTPAPPAPGPTVEAPPAGHESDFPDRSPLTVGDHAVTDLLGGVGAVLAAGVFAGLVARRRLQLLRRAVGRRVLPVGAELERFWTSLGRRSSTAGTASPTGPTGVVLGWDDDEPVWHDLERAGCTLVRSHDPDVAWGLSAAVLTGLACSPWSTETEVTVVGDTEGWVAGLDDPRIRGIAGMQDGLADLQAACAARRIAMGSARLSDLRDEADLAEAWAPLVYVFASPLPAEALALIHSSLSLGRVGISVHAICPDDERPDPRRATVVTLDREGLATLRPSGRRFSPQLMTAPARHAVIGLFTAAASDETEPAPWWTNGRLPANVHSLPRNTTTSVEDEAMPERTPTIDHPTLLLLGPVELVGCVGAAPSRAATASIECCAWLLAHPGATPTQMAEDLAIAEGTRRSNTSRLRGWLGTDPDGQAYLPDAYSGRLELHPDVSSDWERFQLLLAGGVNMANDALLLEALDLVRGEPLQQVAFQWPWADQLRRDMISAITDAAAVLFDRALLRNDLATARRALAQGLLAAGEDEVLAVRRVQLLAAVGDRRGMDQAVMHLTRAAKASGRDLAPDSVERIRAALNLAAATRAAN